MSNSEKSNKSFVIGVLFLTNFIIGIALIGAYLNTHISPNTIPYLSFLGLAYPYLLIVSVVFSFFWLFTRFKYLLFNILVFVLGWNHFTDFYAFNNTISSVSANSVKLMSYNVKIFNYYDVENRIETRDNIFKLVKEKQADIYCFQEFFRQKQAKDFVTRDKMLSFLDTKFYHERYTHEMSGEKFFGLITFSKYPIINKGGVSFKNDANNYCIYSDIVIDRDTVRVYNAHIGSIRLNAKDYELFRQNETESISEKEEQIKGIVERLKNAFEKRAIQIEKIMAEVELSPYPTILCGDFNDTPVSYCYNQITDKLTDSFIETASGIGQTYIGTIPSNRIDYIFHSKDIKATSFEVYDVDYSDHKPISNRFEIVYQ